MKIIRGEHNIKLRVKKNESSWKLGNSKKKNEKPNLLMIKDEDNSWRTQYQVKGEEE